MEEENKSALEKLEELLKEHWKKSGNASIIAARHTEFVIEPKVFIGNKINPEILKMLVINYLNCSAAQDSGIGGNVETTPDRLVIKNAAGKPLVAVRDKNLIQQYLAAQA